jgi:hypothetical protein
MRSPRRKRSRSRHSEDFKYPPSNSKEFKAVVLMYLATEKLALPSDALSMLRSIRMLQRGSSARMFMKGVRIEPLLRDLQDRGALKLQPISIGMRDTYLIMDISKDFISQLSRETSKDRPKKQASPTRNKDAESSEEDTFKIDELLNSVPEDESKLIERLKNEGPDWSDLCPNGRKENCKEDCPKRHYRKVINEFTRESLGECSYITGCIKQSICPFLHYTLA